jgi:hypothetical protein
MMKETIFRGTSTSCRCQLHVQSAQARFAYVYEKGVAPVDIAVFTLRTPRIWLFGDVEVV